MNIVGLEPCSFSDWPGCIVAVVFVQGCNLSCYFCHNRRIIEVNPHARERQNVDRILSWLEMRRAFLDGVVISGGEPTLQPKLAEFSEKVRILGFKTKLDTNGTRPEVLEGVLKKGLFDYVAMDIKASTVKYDSVCGAHVDQSAILRSIRLIMDLAPDYEFRTTLLPELTVADMLDIARRIQGARRYVLQAFRKPPVSDIQVDLRNFFSTHSEEMVNQFVSVVKPFVQQCELRNFSFMRGQVLSV